MKIHTHVLFVVSLLTLWLGGCQSTAQQRIYNAYAGYDAALGAIIEARKSGLISDAAYPRIEAARASAKLALDTAKARAATQPSDAKLDASEAEASLARLITALQEINR